MLYQMNEVKNFASAPMRVMADVIHELYSNPMLPVSHTHFGRSVAAKAEIVSRALRHYARPDFRLDTTMIDGKEVAVEEEFVLSLRFCNLLHFKRDTDRKDPKVLICAPLSGHYATLLRGTVEDLLPNHDVYITDWRNARNIPLAGGEFTLDTYIDYVTNFMEMLGPDVHCLAVCQPGVPVMAAVALMAEDKIHCKPRSMILMGGPMDTRVSPTEVNKLAEQRPIEWFEKNMISTVPAFYPGFMRKVYPGFMQLGSFISMNLDRHKDAQKDMYKHLIEGDGDSAAAHREFYDEYLAVMDLPAEFYLQTVATVFQRHDLPKGEMMSEGRLVNTKAIDQTALMTIEGARDDITGQGQTHAAHDFCPNIPEEKRVKYTQPKVGHYGVFNGKRYREEIVPRIHKFIRDNA